MSTEQSKINSKKKNHKHYNHTHTNKKKRPNIQRVRYLKKKKKKTSGRNRQGEISKKDFSSYFLFVFQMKLAKVQVFCRVF